MKIAIKALTRGLSCILIGSLIAVAMPSCSPDDPSTSEDESDSDEEEGNSSTITFHLDTRSSDSSEDEDGESSESSEEESTTTADEIQTEEEKTVTKVLIVLFKDPYESISISGTEDAETDKELFYSYEIMSSVSEEQPLSASTTYSMQIPSEGHYQMCFVANPPSTLFDDIASLTTGSSSITDFKSLVVDQDPATKPMLMMSKHFYSIISTEDTQLGVVTLNRIMSRIDIINLVEGVTIDSTTLKNRTSKCLLVNDSNFNLNTSFLDADQTYELSLVGNPDDPDGTSKEEAEDGDTINACKATIYSYEHFGTDSYSPILTLTYHKGSDTSVTYTHDVEFTSVDEESGDTARIYLKRNTCYTVSVQSSDSSSLTASVSKID